LIIVIVVGYTIFLFFSVKALYMFGML